VNDTTEQMETLYRQLLLSRSGAERMHMGARMFDTARHLVLHSLPPDLPEEERRRLLFKRLYPELPPLGVPPDQR
jgi:hypothetical protein